MSESRSPHLSEGRRQALKIFRFMRGTWTCPVPSEAVLEPLHCDCRHNQRMLIERCAT
jgi:hypothetical protein